MATDDFFRSRLDQMIDLRHPLAVLAGRIPWLALEASLAPSLAHRDRKGRVIEGMGLFGPTLELAGAGVSPAGRPRLPIRLMASLLYLKHAFNLSDEAVVERWSENVIWQYFRYVFTGVALHMRMRTEGRERWPEKVLAVRVQGVGKYVRQALRAECLS